MSAPPRGSAHTQAPRRRARAPRRTERSRPRHRHPTRHADWGLFAVLAMGLCLAVYAYGQFRVGYDLTTGFVLAPLLVAAALPLFQRMGRSEDGFDLRNLLVTAFALHLAAAYFRLADGADSILYHQVGRDIAAELRSFNFAPELGREFLGTGFLRYLSGVVQVFTFDNRFATFLVFTTISFVGLTLMYRAFVIALPNGDRYRYAKLVLLWPSLVFWPSSIGKEAWMMLAIGLTALGAARLFSRQPRGIVYLALGLVGCLLVRPHVAALLITAVFVGFLLRSSGGDPLRTAGKIVGVLVLVAATGFVATQNAEYFQLEDLGADSLEQVAQGTIEQTQQGGSEFSPARVRTPLDYPWAAVTVVVRPFPFEVDADESLVNAIEGLALFGIALASARRFKQLPGLLRHNPYMIFAVTYILTFVWAFSSISNFGILARQRTQVLPFVFVFLALPVVAKVKRRPRGEPEGAPVAARP